MLHPTRRRLLISAAGLGLATALPGAALAAPKSRLLAQRWARSGTGTGPDHTVWDTILARAVSKGGDGINRVDYPGLNRNRLSDYLAGLLAVDPTTLTQSAGFAYWVNLYNAVTVELVARAYPVGSIREIGGGIFSPGPWQEKVVRVADEMLSLDDIEHGILRPVWADPRVHYAVNCAALGCPDLAPRAFTSDRLETMLEQGARAYVNHPRGARVRDGKLRVSSIYTWFKEDFGGSDAGVIAHLKTYADPGLKSALETVTRIASDRYDWDLNV